MLLLVLVAANLVNLFIARGAARSRQTAIRLAMGCAWTHLIRLQLIEAMILGVIAAAVGLVLAAPGMAVGRALLMPGVDWVRPLVDARVALLALGISIGVGSIVAIWGSLIGSRIDPAVLLRAAGSANSSGTRASHALRRTLLVVQAAVFAVLITGASAFVLSLRRASNVDFGFDVKDPIAVSIPFPDGTSKTAIAAFMHLRAIESPPCQR